MGVGAGALYAIACASLTLLSTEPTSISEIATAVMYLALLAVVLAAYGGIFGLVAGLASGVVVGVALAVTARWQGAGSPPTPRATLTQRIVGAVGGAIAVVALGVWFTAWFTAYLSYTAPRGVVLALSPDDRLLIGVVFIVGPALITAAVCAWRSPAIVRSGVRDRSLGSPEARRAAVAQIDNAAANDLARPADTASGRE